MNWKAARTSAALVTLFLLVYGGCNWFTSYRHDVGSLYFPFERHTPFIPLMIIPYLSIDLFFISAPFFCRDDEQRRILITRLLLEITVAAACFLLFPLRFAFPRPAVSGMLGVAFNLFRTLDLPFNQLPSLHVAQLMVFAPVFIGRARPPVKPLLVAWFALIILSTLFTYQHHIMDVVGGFALAALAFYVVPEPAPVVVRSMRNKRVGSYYLLASLVLAFAGVSLRPIGLLLIWPATSLLIATAGYWSDGAAIFRKRNGRLPFTTYVMLWPILIGQYFSLLYYRRQCNAWDRLTDRVWIGRKLNAGEVRQAIAQGVTAVLDLTGEFSEASPFSPMEPFKTPHSRGRTPRSNAETGARAPGCEGTSKAAINYLQLPILDLTAPSPEQLDRAIDFINQATASGIVYVHCKIGYSRTAAVAGAWLLANGMAESAEQAVAKLRAVRRSMVIRPEAMLAIGNYKSVDVVRGEPAPPMPSAAL